MGHASSTGRADRVHRSCCCTGSDRLRHGSGRSRYPPSIPDPFDAATADVIYARRRAEKGALLESLVAGIGTFTDDPVPAQPTLLIWGRHDTVFPLELGRELAQRLDAELRVIDRARHAPNVEHPDEFDRILRTWLGRSDVARREM